MPTSPSAVWRRIPNLPTSGIHYHPPHLWFTGERSFAGSFIAHQSIASSVEIAPIACKHKCRKIISLRIRTGKHRAVGLRVFEEEEIEGLDIISHEERGYDL